MKTEELIALGVSDDIATKILVINGKDIEKHKVQAETYKTELDGINEQLKTANTTIDGFKAMDIETIKKSADDWKTKYETDTKALSDKLTKQALDSKIDFSLMGAKAKNTTAVKALLKFDSIKLDGENVLGLTEQLATITKENPYLFGEDDTNPPPGGGDPNKTEPTSLGGALAEHYKN